MNNIFYERMVMPSSLKVRGIKQFYCIRDENISSSDQILSAVYFVYSSEVVICEARLPMRIVNITRDEQIRNLISLVALYQSQYKSNDPYCSGEQFWIGSLIREEQCTAAPFPSPQSKLTWVSLVATSSAQINRTTLRTCAVRYDFSLMGNN